MNRLECFTNISEWFAASEHCADEAATDAVKECRITCELDGSPDYYFKPLQSQTSACSGLKRTAAQMPVEDIDSFNPNGKR